MMTYEQRERRKAMEALPVETVDLRAVYGDLGVWAFGLLALAALLVSMPATYAIMARYHAHDEVGTMQAVASLVVFELGAVVSKLATLVFPWWKTRLTALQVALLVFVAGANAMATTDAAPAGETLQAFAFAGLLPFFQFVFLLLTVARVKALHIARLEAQETRQPTQAERLHAALADAQERQFKTMLEQLEQAMTISIVQPAALPQPSYPVPVQAASVDTSPSRFGGLDDAADVAPTRNAPTSERTYTCKRCGGDGFTFAELGRHSRGCKSV